MSAKKQNSGVTVAIVYAVALAVFLVVFGVVGYLAIKNFVPGAQAEESQTEESVQTTYSEGDSSTILYTVSNSQNKLLSIVITKFMPSTQKIVIIPLSPYTKCGEDVLQDVYLQSGIGAMTEQVGTLLNIKIDKYMTMSDTTFSEVINLMGSSMITLLEDFEMYDKASDNYIQYKRDDKISVDGDTAAALISNEEFIGGHSTNMKLSGEIAAASANAFFSHTEYARNNIDLVFKKQYTDADTNMSVEDYNKMKNAIVYVIENSSSPAYSLTPTGGWNDDGTFEISEEFVSQLDGYLS